MDSVRRSGNVHVCYSCHGPAQATPENPSITRFCEMCGHNGEGQIRSTIRNELGQLVVINLSNDEKAARMVEAFRPLADIGAANKIGDWGFKDGEEYPK